MVVVACIYEIVYTNSLIMTKHLMMTKQDAKGKKVIFIDYIIM